MGELVGRDFLWFVCDNDVQVDHRGGGCGRAVECGLHGRISASTRISSVEGLVVGGDEQLGVDGTAGPGARGGGGTAGDNFGSVVHSAGEVWPVLPSKHA